MEVGTLEADDVLWEDPHVHVLAPNNIPLWVLHVVDGTVVIVTAWVELGGHGTAQYAPRRSHRHLLALRCTKMISYSLVPLCTASQNIQNIFHHPDSR